MATRQFTLTDNSTGKSSTLEALSPSVGPDVLNIAPLAKDHGAYTFDPGFMSTASTLAIAGTRQDAILVRLNAPPVDGAANDALVAGDRDVGDLEGIAHGVIRGCPANEGRAG